MITISRIFSHHITKNTGIISSKVRKTFVTAEDSFVQRKKTKSLCQRITEWWDNFVYSRKVLEGRERDYRLNSAEEYPIAQRRGLFLPDLFHPERILDSSEIDSLVTLSDKEFNNFEKRKLMSLAFPRRDGWNIYCITSLAKLSDNDFANITKRGLNATNSPLKQYIRSAWDLTELASLGDKEFENITSRKLMNPKLYKNYSGKLDGTDIAMLAKLPDDVFCNIQKRNLTSKKYYAHFHIWDIADLAKLSDEAFLNIEKRGLMSKNFISKYDITSGEDICALAELPEEKFEFAKKFLEGQFINSRNPAAVGRMLKENSVEAIKNLQKVCSNSEIISLFSEKKGMTFLRKLGIVKLITDKKISTNVVKSLAETINYGDKKLPNEIISDINLLRERKSVVEKFSLGTSLQKAFDSTKTGDAVQVGEKMFINDGEKLVPWQMNIKTFDKLFPPVERFMIKQKGHDCYLLSAISSCLKNPTARTEIYKSFKTDGDDIICTIRAYKDFKGSVKFPNGKVPPGCELPEACQGVRMLEYAYAKTALRFDTGVPEYLNSRISTHSLLDRIDGGSSSDTFHELLGLERIDSYELPQINKKTGLMEIKDTPKSRAIPLPKRYSLQSIFFYDWDKVLRQYANKDGYILNFGTFNDASNRAYDIIEHHAYEIVGYDPIKKIVQFINPHDSAGVISMPVSQLDKYSSKIYIAKVK